MSDTLNVVNTSQNCQSSLPSTWHIALTYTLVLPIYTSNIAQYSFPMHVLNVAILHTNQHIDPLLSKILLKVLVYYLCDMALSDLLYIL